MDADQEIDQLSFLLGDDGEYDGLEPSELISLLTVDTVNSYFEEESLVVDSGEEEVEISIEFSYLTVEEYVAPTPLFQQDPQFSFDHDEGILKINYTSENEG